MALREVLADLRVRVRGARQLGDVNRNVGGAVRNLRAAGAALGAAGAAISSALAVRELAQWTRELINVGDELDKTSQQLQVSVGGLQRWRFVADRSGVSTEQLDVALLTLGRNAGAAARGTGEAVQAFRLLGVSLRDGEGNLRGTEEIFRQTMIALSGVTSETERAFLASRIFGESGSRLLTVANLGAEGIEELSRRFDELGGGMGEDFVAQAAAAQDALTDWNTATASIKAELATAFLPLLTRALNAFVEWGRKVSDALSRSNAMRVALYALAIAAGALALALAPVVLATLAMMAPFALVVLVIEDLITMFRGGQSAIGDFIDATFGAGTTQTIVEALTAAWEGLVSVLREAGELLGIVDEAGPPGRTPRAQARMRTLGKEESTPDGAEARRAVGRARALVASGAASPTRAVGARSVSNVSSSAVSQQIAVSPTIRVEGARDPEATARAVERATSGSLARALQLAAATVPAGEG